MSCKAARGATFAGISDCCLMPVALEITVKCVRTRVESAEDEGQAVETDPPEVVNLPRALTVAAKPSAAKHTQ